MIGLTLGFLDTIPTIGEQVDALEMAIRSLEAWEKLYEETAEWEAQALDEVRKHIHDEDAGEWRKWSHILTERTAFSCDVKKHLKELEDDNGRNG